MTQENKDILLKYLCMSLPYRIQVLADIDKTFDGGIIGKVVAINLELELVYLEGVLTPFYFDEIKPYLRPMSSMTEEEKELLKKEHVKDEKLYLDAINGDGSMRGKVIPHYAADWCNKNHFDFMDLIPKDLAIEVTESNNPYKK